MSKLQLKAFIYQLIGFGILFVLIRYLIIEFAHVEELWAALGAFVIGTFLAPQFRAVKTQDGEKLFMKWIFMKGIKEIK